MMIADVEMNTRVALRDNDSWQHGLRQGADLSLLYTRHVEVLEKLYRLEATLGPAVLSLVDVQR